MSLSIDDEHFFDNTTENKEIPILPKWILQFGDYIKIHSPIPYAMSKVGQYWYRCRTAVLWTTVPDWLALKADN